MIPTRAEMKAMAAFLLSEKQRHQEDIDMIDQKLLMLAKKGIVADEAAPWFTEEDILAGPKSIDGPYEFVPHNESPLGGYWKYRLDKAFENTTKEDEFDGIGTA
jgi:hypothetical protein